MIYWDDLETGQVFQTDSITLTAEDIIDYASDFDPQPYHLDNEAAEASIFGGLCASGWQVSALMMRLLTDTFHAKDIAILGVASVQEVRWKLPVFADDSLDAQVSITDRAEESGQAGVGTVDVAVQVSNQNNKPVIIVQNRLLIAHAKVEVSNAG